jgi:hypothetical protein
MLEPTRGTTLHGRLLIVALARLDHGLEEYLSTAGFLRAIQGEITEPLESLFVVPARAANAPFSLPDPAPLHLDNPSADDRLGRRGFARALATRLERIWNEYGRSGARSSFILHLHGPWGAGKTSLLNLLRDELQPRLGASHQIAAAGPPQEPVRSDVMSRWIVVSFNAWQLQRLDPPWWPLLDAVYRQSRAQLRSLFGERRRALRLLMNESWWRLLTSRRDTITALGLLVLCAGILYWPLRRVVLPLMGLGAADVGTAVKVLSNVLALIATVGSAGLLLSRSLLSGSARATQAFLHSKADPMDSVCRHFRDLVALVRHPIAVFIDDLDRCQSSFVVGLLEGIQTLFADPRVIYIIAADKRWLYACFEQTYDRFTPAIREPGRRLGSLFLEKAVQLSVSVPRLSPELKAAYWRFLIKGGAAGDDEQLDHAQQEARSEFAAITTEYEVFAQLGSATGSPIQQQARRQAAVERLASARVEESTSFFLEPFAPLLEPNPRAMKRLINAYAVNRDLAILAGLDVLADVQQRQQLALWTIVSLRWPALEEYFVQVVGGNADAPAADLRALLDSTEVKEVLNGSRVGATLDLLAIAALTGSPAPATGPQEPARTG